jgi:hypothetical protein
MKNKYLEYQEKMDNFNRWEEEYLKNLSVERKLWQFVQLYQLKEYFPKTVVTRIHNEHLENLIESQKILSKMYESQKSEE